MTATPNYSYKDLFGILFEHNQISK